MLHEAKRPHTEDDASIRKHMECLETDKLKDTDRYKIAINMTFADRRRLILSNQLTTDEIFLKFPFLSDEDAVSISKSN